MGIESKIQWTESTWNPWHGCHKVSPGCRFCYMYRDKRKYGQDPNVVVRSKSNFNNPLKWTDPKLIFTCSWSDWFIKEADIWRHEAWEIIKRTPHHTYQILTKRPDRILKHLPSDWGDGYDNVWLGISAENQNTFIDRYAMLCDVPAKIRFLSLEPLIGRIPLMVNSEFLNWIIVGGESGNDIGEYRYRECDIQWIELIVRRAKEYGVPVFVKQLGTHLAKQLKLKDRHGGDINEWPDHLRIREMPKPLITV